MTSDDREFTRELKRQRANALRMRPFQRDGKPTVAQRRRYLEVSVGEWKPLLRLDALAGTMNEPVITTLPSMHPAFSGLVCRQGEILPVVDLAALLTHGASKESRFLVFARSEPRFALLVEGASELANVPVEKLAPPHSLPENIAELASHELDEHRFVLDLELVRHAVIK